MSHSSGCVIGRSQSHCHQRSIGTFGGRKAAVRHRHAEGLCSALIQSGLVNQAGQIGHRYHLTDRNRRPRQLECSGGRKRFDGVTDRFTRRNVRMSDIVGGREGGGREGNRGILSSGHGNRTLSRSVIHRGHSHTDRVARSRNRRSTVTVSDRCDGDDRITVRIGGGSESQNTGSTNGRLNREKARLVVGDRDRQSLRRLIGGTFGQGREQIRVGISAAVFSNRDGCRFVDVLGGKD